MNVARLCFSEWIVGLGGQICLPSVLHELLGLDGQRDGRTDKRKARRAEGPTDIQAGL